MLSNNMCSGQSIKGKDCTEGSTESEAMKCTVFISFVLLSLAGLLPGMQQNPP